MWRSVRSRRRVVVSAGIIVVVVVVVSVVVARPWVHVYIGSAGPDQFYRALSPPAANVGHQVLGVAHNAGNHAATTAAALEYGADVIEIDVITARGTLVAGRAHGWPWLAERVFRGQTLARAWQHAEAAKIIKLDLQQTDQGLLKALVGFLRGVPASRPVMVSTRDAAAIDYLRPRLPGVVKLLFSVPFPGGDPHS
jgi:glycerophosphoryl diester phosphodiesterase